MKTIFGTNLMSIVTTNSYSYMEKSSIQCNITHIDRFLNIKPLYMCGNMTSFFIMRGNQTAEVVAGWACFHSTDEILKFLLK